MRAPLSIVIPTLNAAEALPGLFAALMEGVEAGLVREVIVADGGSGDATRALARDAGAKIVGGARGRGAQLAAGADLARGDWLLFVHADSWPAPGWSSALAAHMARHPDRAAAFRLKFRASGFGAWRVAGWANLRSRLFGLPYGDQGLLISRRLYTAVGGYRPIPLMEDVAMARTLKTRLMLLAHRIETGAGRYQKEGWSRRGARNLWLLARYLAGADPQRLAKAYEKP